MRVKKKRVKNAKLVENLRNLSYRGEVLLKWAAVAGNGGDATEVDDHMLSSTSEVVVRDVG
jgi:hypothetical protein